jgi:hypothetical protein
MASSYREVEIDLLGESVAIELDPIPVEPSGDVQIVVALPPEMPVEQVRAAFEYRYVWFRRMHLTRSSEATEWSGTCEGAATKLTPLLEMDDTVRSLVDVSPAQLLWTWGSNARPQVSVGKDFVRRIDLTAFKKTTVELVDASGTRAAADRIIVWQDLPDRAIRIVARNPQGRFEFWASPEGPCKVQTYDPNYEYLSDGDLLGTVVPGESVVLKL